MSSLPFKIFTLRLWVISGFSDLSKSSNNSAASLPRDFLGWSKAVSGGLGKAEKVMLSKHATDTYPGMLKPARR